MYKERVEGHSRRSVVGGKGRGVTTRYLESAIKRCDSRLKISYWPIPWREKIRSNPSPFSSSSSSSFFPASFWRQARTCLNAATSRRIRRKCELPLFLSRQTIFQGRAASSLDQTTALDRFPTIYYEDNIFSVFFVRRSSRSLFPSLNKQ